MKTIKAILITTIALVFNFNVKAQVVSGSNLNIGENNTLTQTGNTYHSNAIGKGNYLEGNYSLAVGENDTILYPGGASVALGSCNKVAENASFAIGSNVKVLGLRGIGIGHLVKVSGPSGSMAIGSGMLGSYSTPNLFLTNSYNRSLIIGFHSTKPTLTVGPSPNDYPNGNLIDRTGKVAIGDVPVPEIAAKLHIRSDEGEDAGIFMEPKDQTSNTFIRLRDENHRIEVDNAGIMRIKSKNGNTDSKLLLYGRVGINIANDHFMNSSYSLCVRGGIMTDKINIKNVNHWPDYVFSSNYLLMPLSDLKFFITENHHLPEVPSENDIMAEGIEIGDMQGILLKKVEEMTLYILQLQEQIDKLEQRINELEEN